MFNYFAINNTKNIYKKTKIFLSYYYSNLTDHKTKILILVYHRVLADAKFNPLNNIVSLSTFVRQIDAIAKRYYVTTLSDIVRQCRFGQIRDKTQAVFTFDDGYRDNYETVFPILQKKGLPAIFFVSTQYINSGRPLWDWQIIDILHKDTSIKSIEIGNQVIRQGLLELRMSFIFRILNKLKPISFQDRHSLISSLQVKSGLRSDYNNDRCMSWDEVREMSDAGMEIGSHSLSHRSLSTIPFFEAKEEIRKSKEIIENNIKKPCNYFCFPYGANPDYNQQLIDYIKEAGYQACLLNIHGYNHLEKDAFYFKRIIMEESTNLQYIIGDHVKESQTQEKYSLLWPKYYKISIGKPIVSVIIPAHNAALFIADTIASVLAQTMPDCEIIVVDDGSTDNTVEIVRGLVKQDSRIRYFVQERKGVSSARNRGIKESVGKYIAFIDHDDLWAPQKLQKQLNLFNQDHELGLVYSRALIIKEDGKAGGFTGGIVKPYRGYVFKELFCDYIIPISSVLIKREVFDMLDEWFVESMEMAEEIDLFLRIAYKWKIDYCNEILTKWRMHPKNDSRLRRGLLIDDYNSIIARLKQKIPDFEAKYKKVIIEKQKWLRILEIEILISGNNKKLAIKKIFIFLKDFGFYPQAMLKFFMLFTLGPQIYEKARLYILQGVQLFMMKESINQLKRNQTQEKYSFLWLKYYNQQPQKIYHFNHMQDVISDKIVRGAIGIDIGCGCGWDVFRMAKNNPFVRIIGMDISDGIYSASRLCADLTNVSIIRGSTERIPLKEEVCDFVYSFGVLHHLTDYKKGFLEAVRILKRDHPCFLYLYEKHSGNSIKYIGIKIVSFIRKITVMSPPRLLYFLCSVASPFVVILFSYPARLFKKFRLTRGLYERMPFNFADGLFSLTGDLYDRFAIPLEHRFSREEVLNIFTESGFYNINITKLKDTAGWVAWGYKR